MENTLEQIKGGWMSISAASKITGIPRPTIYVWIKRGIVGDRYPPGTAIHQVRLEDVLDQMPPEKKQKEGGDQG